MPDEARLYRGANAALVSGCLKDPEILLAGPSGTGKSMACCEYVNRLCMDNPGIRVLMVRKTRESLTESGLVTLERIVTELSAHFGWEEMAQRVPVRCFQFDPSVKSSLTFLRKTPWARKKVEALYVQSLPPR